MLLRTILERERSIIDKILARIRGLLRRHSPSITQNVIITLALALFIFLLSGGVVTSFVGAAEQLIYVGLSTGQTLVELIAYIFIHTLYLLGLYLMYRSLRTTRLDQGTLAAGLLLFLISLLLEWYLMHIKRIV
ncbi:MAG: hypothetical protein QXH96_00720 [Candidatus Geothermarchaeota archaeon]